MMPMGGRGVCPSVVPRHAAESALVWLVEVGGYGVRH